MRPGALPSFSLEACSPAGVVYAPAPMQDATPDDFLFRLVDETDRDDGRLARVEATPYTGGPWNPAHQHGGAVAALVTRCIDRLPTGAPMRLARLGLDLTRGVPVGPLEVETRIARDGRRIQSVDAIVRDGERTVARATALRIRIDDGLAELDAGTERDPEVGTPPETVPPFQMRAGIEIPGFVRACRLVSRPGAATGETGTTWTRLVARVFEHETPSAIERLAAIADFASGTGNVMDYTRWTSINPDLTVHVLRAPASEWLAIRGVTRRAGDGIGQSEALIHDEAGPIARATASLLLDRR